MSALKADPEHIEISLRHRVWLRLVLVTTMLLVIAVGATAAFVARLAAMEIRGNVTQRNSQLAKRAAEEIDFFIESAEHSLAQLANVLALTERQPWVRDVLLENYVIATGDFERVILVDGSGAISADSLLVRAVTSDFDAEAVRKAMAGVLYVSTVRLDADGMPCLTMVCPLSSSAAGAASLVGELRLRRIWSIVEGIALGSKSSAYVTSSDGTLIAHSDATEVLRRDKSFGLMEEPGLRVESPISSVGWIVVIEQPSAEAFLPVSLLLQRAFVLVLLVILVVAYLAFFSVRMISRPLDALLRGTVLIGGGAAEYRIPVDSHDEFGILSRSFNEMVERLQERAFALEESERKYRIVAESVNDIIFSLDAQGRFVFLNRRVEQVLGYHLHEMIGRLFVDFVSMEEMATKALGFLQGLSNRSKYLLPAELPLISKSGEEVILECEAVPIHEPTGEIRIHGVARDITERKRLEEKLKRTEKLSAMGEVVSGVAHELRNAVSGITASMEMVRSRDGNGLGKDLDRVLAEATRAQRIVHNLLDFSKDKPTSIHPCSLNTAIEDVAELLRRDIESERIDLRINLDSELPDVLAGSEQLRQVLLNLVTNAIQAMKGPTRGSLSAYQATARILTLRTIARDGFAVATVEDTGPGIQKKFIDRIFDPFFTTKRQGEGTGLGLSISLGIVHSLGGDIRVQSSEGKGACFSVELPIVSTADEQICESDGLTPFDLSTRRILVVEDEDSIREFICNFLQSYGCRVDSARDVREAVSLLSDSLPPDVVISDFRMPEIDGQGLYEWIRSNKPILLTRIMYITGDGLNQMTRAFLQRTGVPYLLKPVNSLTLVRAIQPLLAGMNSSNGAPRGNQEGA